MSYNLFSQLLKLYRNNLARIPLEDFITEAFTGVLYSSEVLIDKFVNEVLRVNGVGFHLETQKRYNSNSSIIDMVFENEECICFVENKVESSEGYEQLNKYAKILSESNKKSYLFYCTKYFDKKDGQNYTDLGCEKFLQYKWSDVYDFLYKNRINNIVKMFLSFLEEESMNSIQDFSQEDIVCMKRMFTTISKMSEIFQFLTPEFEKYFGSPKTRDNPAVKQIQKYNQYAMWTDAILAGKKHSEILLAFSFEDDLSPKLRIQIWCDNGHEQYEKFVEVSKKELPYANCYITQKGINVWFDADLTDFISKENQFDEIKLWFVDKMIIINEFVQKTQKDSLLNWHLKE